MGDDRELFYLLEFLQVAIDLQTDYSQDIAADWLCSMADFIKASKKTNLKRTGRGKALKKMPSEENVTEAKMDEEETSEKLVPELTQLGNLFGDQGNTRLGMEEPKLQTLAEAEKVKIETSLSRILDEAHKETDFTLVSLPENFYESYHGFIYKSCDICHSRHSTNDRVQCMLCGMIMCTHLCYPSDKKNRQAGSLCLQVGNLYSHALLQHNSNSVFFNAYNGQYILYEGLRCFYLSGLYINSFGLSVNELKRSDVDYKLFNLDSEKLNKIKKDILDLNLDLQIVNLNLSENLVYLQGYL